MKGVKTVLMYGLETAITREDSDKLSALFNKARRMALKTCSRKTYTAENLALKVPLRDIKMELAVRRAKLSPSLTKLHNEEIITRRRRTYSKDCMRALKT